MQKDGRGCHEPGVLVIGRESRGVRRFGDSTRRGDLLESIYALSSGVECVHQMHGGWAVMGLVVVMCVEVAVVKRKKVSFKTEFAENAKPTAQLLTN
jgi:hypothetical protein